MRGVSLWLGIDEVRLNHPAQAVPLLRDAARQDPQDKQAQSWLGTALWNAGQTDAALLQLRKAAAQFSDDPDLLFALGEAYGKAAKRQSEQLLEDSAGTAISDRIYAGTYAADGDWTKAEGHLRRAIVRDPQSVDAHLDLAEVFLNQHRRFRMMALPHVDKTAGRVLILTSLPEMFLSARQVVLTRRHHQY